MHDIALVEAIAQILYPFIALLAWWNVHRQNKRIKEEQQQAKRQLSIHENKINGRLDELIEAERKLAYERGRKDVIAEMLMGKMEKS